MLTLAFLSPGHFHAALTLRERHPLLNEDVYVYAEAGAETDAFLALVEAFNTRSEAPTAWRPHVESGEQPLTRLLAARDAGTALDAVVLAGRNDTKMADIRALHAAGLHVLGDKPWVTGPDCLPDLEAATAGSGALAMDIMTSHYEPNARLQWLLVREPAVFGEWRCDDPAGAAIHMESVHHLYKTVNDVPLVRPPWYFDPRVQGDGIVDVPTHLVDLVQWLLGGPALNYARDVALDAARLWSTDVPATEFKRITQAPAFPAWAAPWVRGDVLAYPCNGEFRYRLRGVPVHLHSVWNLAVPPGGGDTKHAVLRGTRAELVLSQGPQTGFAPHLAVHPRPGADGVGAALEAAVARWQRDWPGLAVVPEAGGAGDGAALRLQVPPALRSTHEEHFAMVLDAFLRYLQAGQWPAEIAANLRAKYTLLARASALAGGAGPTAGGEGPP